MCVSLRQTFQGKSLDTILHAGPASPCLFRPLELRPALSRCRSPQCASAFDSAALRCCLHRRARGQVPAKTAALSSASQFPSRDDSGGGPGLEQEGQQGSAATGGDVSGSSATAEGQRPWWQIDSAELRAKVAKLGLAAVLAYGLFDGVTYTTFFFLAFLGYEKSTGQNPAANLKALLGIVVLMWTGNNVTRPFRVAGAAAAAPVLDRALRRIQEALKLPNQVLAFALVVVSFATACFSVVGLLILSRLGK